MVAQLRSFLLTILLVVVGAIRWAIIFIALLFLLAPIALDYFHAGRGNAATSFIYTGHAYVRSVVGTRISDFVPTKFAGKDRTDWVLAAGCLVLAGLVGSLQTRIRRKRNRQQVRQMTERWKQEMGVPGRSIIATDLEAKIETLQTGKKIDRQQLLKVFAETKRKLDALGRDLSFLSIDIVSSTAMKQSEEPAAVQHDFDEYRRLVEGVLVSRKAIKSTWTPDGMMACFSDIDDAVQAGQDVIHDLAEFNRSVKLIRADFSVRCGVNSGYVYFDESTPLEAMCDRAIDIAGHMQKYADPNTVAIARTIIEPMRGVDGFAPTQRVVDGYEVYSWAPNPKTV